MTLYNQKTLIVPAYTSNLVILKTLSKYYIYIYNKNFYFISTINNNCFNIYIDSVTLSLNLRIKNPHNFPILKIAHFHNKQSNRIISTKLSSIINSWDIYYFIKIKFKGKVYKLTKLPKNNLKLSFGRCHKNLMVVRSLFLKKKKKIKTKCLLFGVNKSSLNISKQLLTNVRPINMFTQRGLRLSRQIVYRKIGKKSSYTAK